jgi:hypothetical protein
MSEGRDNPINVVDLTERILAQLQLPHPYGGLDRIGLIVVLSDDMLRLSIPDLVSLAIWMKERARPAQADSDR